jgi:hypothetical protein
LRCELIRKNDRGPHHDRDYTCENPGLHGASW